MALLKNEFYPRRQILSLYIHDKCSIVIVRGYNGLYGPNGPNGPNGLGMSRVEAIRNHQSNDRVYGVKQKTGPKYGGDAKQDTP